MIEEKKKHRVDNLTVLNNSSLCKSFDFYVLISDDDFFYKKKCGQLSLINYVNCFCWFPEL